MNSEHTLLPVTFVVAIASANGRYGGPFDVAIEQQRMISEKGYRATVVAGFLPGDEPKLTNPSWNFSQVRRILPLPGFMGYFSLRFLRSCWRACRGSRIVHIAVSRELLPIAALLIALILRRKVICQPHGMLTSRSSWLHRTSDLLVRPLVGRSEVVISLNPSEEADLRNWVGGRAAARIRWRVVENPTLAGGRYLDASVLNSQVLFLARLHPRKRVSDFIAASAIAAVQGLPGNYVVVGPDAGDLPLVNRALDEPRPSFQYLGAIPGDEVAAMLSTSSIFVLCSFDEPWGVVLATALRLGRPCIVTRSSFLAGKIAEHGAGVVVDDGAPNQIAAAAAALLAPAVWAHASSGALKLADELLGDSSASLTQLYAALQ